MRFVKVTGQVAASPHEVWAVLADFPNISQWNTGVKRSYATSDATAGLGAKRHCDLAPMGTLEETVTGWDEGKQMQIKIESATKLPIARGFVTFTLNGHGTTTDVAIEYRYQPKLGVVGHLIGRLMLDAQLTKGFTRFLQDLEQVSRKALDRASDGRFGPAARVAGRA